MKKENFDYSSDYKFFIVKEILNAIIDDFTVISNYSGKRNFNVSNIKEMKISYDKLELELDMKSRENNVFDMIEISMILEFKNAFGLILEASGVCKVLGSEREKKYQIDYLKALGKLDGIKEGDSFFLQVVRDNDFHNSIRRIYKYNKWNLTREKQIEEKMKDVVIPYEDHKSISMTLGMKLVEYLKSEAISEQSGSKEDLSSSDLGYCDDVNDALNDGISLKYEESHFQN